jgi:hypothetical protein
LNSNEERKHLTNLTNNYIFIFYNMNNFINWAEKGNNALIIDGVLLGAIGLGVWHYNSRNQTPSSIDSNIYQTHNNFTDADVDALLDRPMKTSFSEGGRKRRGKTRSKKHTR